MSKPLFHVAIVGGRDFTDRRLMYEECSRLLQRKFRSHRVVVLSGRARGADQMGEDYARFRGLEIQYFEPDWDKHGRAAGMRRNAVMCAKAEAVIAFWDGKSRGTKQMIALSKKRGRMVRVIRYLRS